MSWGEGRIFTRTRYLWVAYMHKGQEVREVARHLRSGLKLLDTEENRGEALRFLKHRVKEVIGEEQGGRAFVTPADRHLTVNQLLDNLEADYRLRGKWSPNVRTNLKPTRLALGERRAVAVSDEDVKAMMESWLAEGLHPATINRRGQLVAQAYKLKRKAVGEGPQIKRLSEIGNEREGFFERPDFEAVVSHLPEYLQDWARFGFITGWRKGAIASLRWSDVDDRVIYLRAKNSKTRRPVTVPLVGELRDIIERRRALALVESPTGPRFVDFVFHRQGHAINSTQYAWRRACQLANVDGRLFHDLRRTASRNMIVAGVPQAVAMQITGHRTDSMFRRYCIVDERQKVEALARTAEYLAGYPVERKVVAIAARARG